MRTYSFLVVLVFLVLPVMTVGSGSSSSSSSSSSLEIFDVSSSYDCEAGIILLTVRDSDGESVEGAVVAFTDADKKTVRYVTSSDGIVEVSFSFDGTHEFTITKEGFARRLTSLWTGNCARQAAESVESAGNVEDFRSTYLCQDRDTVRERIICRLSLSDDDVREVRYLPEPCRLPDTAALEACVQDYRLFQTCRDVESTERRMNCIKQKLGLTTIRSQVQFCTQELEGSRARCLSSIRASISKYAFFQLYDLEYNIEELMEDETISQSQGYEMLEKIQSFKSRFMAAEDDRSKRTVLVEAKQSWNDFVAPIRTKGE